MLKPVLTEASRAKVKYALRGTSTYATITCISSRHEADAGLDAARDTRCWWCRCMCGDAVMLACRRLASPYHTSLASRPRLPPCSQFRAPRLSVEPRTCRTYSYSPSTTSFTTSAPHHCCVPTAALTTVQPAAAAAAQTSSPVALGVRACALITKR